MKWTVPKIWEGGDVWIIGGGPSVVKEFHIPNELLEKVISGHAQISEYSPYFSVLHNKHVIGINIAFLIGDWIDMVFFGDSNFFLKWESKLRVWNGLKVSCHSITEGVNWVKYLMKDTKRPHGITSNPNKISWNGNSGAAAISVAVNAGAKRIFLLGFDMKLGEGNKQHFHGEYLSKRRIVPQNPRKNLPFYRHLPGFAFIKNDADAMGVKIYNVNPNSAIVELPKISLYEALQISK